MRRWRTITAGLTGIVLGAGLAMGGATSASAATAGHWGVFELSGTNRAYTGTMTMPGFPATTFTSNSRQATAPSGSSVWQSAGTGPGAVYGTSRNLPYLNQRPLADASNPQSAARTVYSFDTPTPAGSWSFVLGDVDADKVTIAATTQSGAAATAADIGFRRTYNSCSVASTGGPSCDADPDGTTGQDVPSWDPATLTLTGNAAAADTAGATAWFTPTVPLTSLTMTFERRAGFPIYQTWFASRTAGLTGTATLDGTPIPGATVTVTAPRGTVYTTTTGADGTYTFPELPVIGGYTVDIGAPSSAEGPTRGTASLNPTPQGQDALVDFPFTAPADTTSIVGVVTDGVGEQGGDPAADVPVVITDAADPTGPPIVETVTNDAGVYTGAGLPADGAVLVSVAGGDPVRVETGAAGTAATPAPIPAPAAVGTVSGVVTLDDAPAAGVVVDLLDADGAVVDTATTDADGGYSFTTVGGAYTVRSALPVTGATGTTTKAVTITAGGPAQTVDFGFASPPPVEEVVTSATGRVVDDEGAPVAGTTVTATPAEEDAGEPVTATTGDDGGYTLEGLAPSTPYVVSVEGQDATVAFTSGATAADVVTVPDLVVPAAVTPEPTPTPTTPTPTPTPSTPAPTQQPTTAPIASGNGGTGTGSTGGPLAYTGADLTPGLIAAGVLVLIGGGLLTFRSVRNRRRTEHLQD